MSAAIDQLRKALAKKNGDDPPPRLPGNHPIPDPIRYIEAGTHIAQDGKPYTVKYEEK